MKKKTEKSALEKKWEAELEAESAASDAGEAPQDGETAETPPDAAGQLEERTAERDDLKEQLLRARAEFDNYRKRMARETERIRKTAAEDLIRNLLPAVDNLERAFDHADGPAEGFAAGVAMVLKQIVDALAAQGLEPIPALGEPFDPNVHEAMSHLPSEEHPADAVMQEFERGYRLGGMVLRPSKVVVSSGPPQSERPESAEEAPENASQGPDQETNGPDQSDIP